MQFKKACAVVLFLFSSLLFSADCAVKQYGELEANSKIELYEAKEKLFSVLIPSSWSKSESGFDYDFREGNITGVKLVGPKNNIGAEVKISVVYYEYSRSMSNYSEYVALVQNTPTREDFPKKEIYKKIVVGGKKAFSFQMKTFDLIFEHSFIKPPDTEADYRLEPPHKKVSMLEKYIIIPAKHGFFALHYESPKDIHKECEPVFHKITNSMRFDSHVPWSK
jgi:hypothetical protein